MIHKPLYNIYIASCERDGGIYQYRVSTEGIVEFVDFTEMDRPMYAVIADDKMYVLLRAPFKDSDDSGLIIYAIDDEGKLTNPSELMSTKGEVACHLCVDKGNVYCTNYISGSVIKLPSKLVMHYGKGIHPSRQEAPHPHFVGVTPDNKYICVADLGKDTVFLYDKDLNLITEAKVPDGHGARHLAFCENMLYCVNELKSTVSVFECDDKRTEHKCTISVLPDDFTGESTASAIRINDNFCYVSNRGHDSVSVLDVSKEQPTLMTTVSTGGASPRDFNIIDDMLICTNEKSNNVTFFKLIKGIPQKTETELNITSPVCVVYKDIR